MVAVDAAPRGLVMVLTGPTGSGKSAVALDLAARLPLEIISVDSAQVYRGMDIGTAKPTLAERATVPHHLIDIRDPAERFSAGDFVREALAAIENIHARGRIPLLVGGTMLYLRALHRGLAVLPAASEEIRHSIEQRARQRGWAALHGELAAVDPEAAARIHPNDPQRIQRALEVHEQSGRSISSWQRSTVGNEERFRWRRHALVPADRVWLNKRLAARFEQMLAQGLHAEVARLHARGDLRAEHSSIRCVGYRQVWSCFEDGLPLAEARSQAIRATCQLAKRQLTWLRTDAGLEVFDPSRAEDLAELARTMTRQVLEP